MLKTKKRENKQIFQNVKLREISPNINRMTLNNNNERKTYLNYDINQRLNKFLSIPERQKIIHEINESKNQLNLHINLYESFNKEKIINKKSLDNKKLLYIKKTKNDLNFFDKNTTENNKNINNKIIQNNKNSNVGKLKNIKFIDNKFAYEAIQEYYQKIDSSFKNYLNTLNNKPKEDEQKNSEKTFSSFTNKNNIDNKIVSKNKDRKSLGKNEIYKKPNLSKKYNKIYMNNNITEENNNPNKINNNNNKKELYLDDLNFISNERKVNINYVKMINNKNSNGSTRIIFNKINNYNTTTFRNDNNNEKVLKLNSKNKKNKEILLKNCTSTILNKNLKNNLNNKKQLENNKNIDNCKNLKLNNINTNYFEENINKIVNRNIKTQNNINNKKYNMYSQNNILEDDNNLNLNLKYIKKNIKSPGPFQNKNRLFKRNFMSNELKKNLIDNKLISLISPYESINNPKTKNIKEYKNKKLTKIKKYSNSPIYHIENNYFKSNDFEKIKKNIYINYKTNNLKNIPNKIKNKTMNKSLTFSFEESSQKEDRKNNSFSYSSKKNENKNYGYKNERFHYKYKSILPSDCNKYKFKYNYLSQNKKQNLTIKHISFPFEKNKKSKNYYNSDDDLMSNSDNNSNKNLYNNVTYKSFDFKSFNENNFNKSKSPIKEYYFNYFGKKISNDFLDENKYNKFENELLRQKSSYTLNQNHLRRAESIDSFNNSKGTNTFFNSFLNTYYPSIFNLKNKNIKKDTNKNFYKDKNIDDNTKSDIFYLKTDNNKEKNDSNKIIINNLERKSELDNVNQSINIKKESLLNIDNDLNSKNNIDNNDIEINEKNNINTSEIKNKNKKNINNQLKKKEDEDNNLNDSEIIYKTNYSNDNIKVEFKNDIEKEKNIEHLINNKYNTIKKNNKDNNKNFIINNSEEPIKKNYINTKLKSSISLDILEYINIISPKNYLLIKNNILNILINNEENSGTIFINILYPIAIAQKKYQPIYAKLCKDLDKYFNKKDKTKSLLRTQLMKYCTANYNKLKTSIGNINNIVNNISFIGELINVRMVSKKVGLQCLNYLINNFYQYNNDKNLIYKKSEKYIYLDCIINFLNKFANTVNYCYQEGKINKDELLVFETEINLNIDILKEILNDKINNDIPSNIKFKILQLIDKSKNNWEKTIYEEYENKILSSLYEDSSEDSIKNIVEIKSDYSYLNNNIIEFNIKNNIIFDFDKSDSSIIHNKNKSYKSVSPINNKNLISESNNKNLFSESNNTNLKKRLKSNKTNNNIHDKNNKILSIYSKKFKNNLISFKIHMDEYKRSDNFNNWNEIGNLFLNKKVFKYEIFKSIIEACKYFIINKNDINYVDIYIKIIFKYYLSCLDINDLNEIVNAALEELSYLSNEELQKDENKFLIDIWIIIIYYLLQNKIIAMNDFNYFCNDYNNEIKANIFTILKGVCCYNLENKKIYLKELKETKFGNYK